MNEIVRKTETAIAAGFVVSAEQALEALTEYDACQVDGEPFADVVRAELRRLTAERDTYKRAFDQSGEDAAAALAEIGRQRNRITARLDELGAERDAAQKALAEVQHKLDNLAERFKALEMENNERRRQLAAVRTDRDGVWVWRGGEENHPESLVCPVVMTADTLREILAERGGR